MTDTKFKSEETRPDIAFIYNETGSGNTLQDGAMLNHSFMFIDYKTRIETAIQDTLSDLRTMIEMNTDVALAEITEATNQAIAHIIHIRNDIVNRQRNEEKIERLFIDLFADENRTSEGV